jgi:hypothetical protein
MILLGKHYYILRHFAARQSDAKADPRAEALPPISGSKRTGSTREMKFN